jgi:uncharacterized protein (TIGR03435 family)
MSKHPTQTLLLLAALIGLLNAQSFEVASVKPNKSTTFGLVGFETLPGGRFKATNMPLRWIITTAYGLPAMSSRRLTGGPDWINSEKFDIEAKPEPGAIPPGLPEKDRRQKTLLLLQSLLRDRFHLQIHRDTRELPIYALVAAKNGPKLPRAAMPEQDCPEVALYRLIGRVGVAANHKRQYSCFRSI